MLVVGREIRYARIIYTEIGAGEVYWQDDGRWEVGKILQAAPIQIR
jgi:hypothetical protein